MKIVYFYQYFGTSSGSWSTRVYEMTRRWASMGHHVTVVTSLYDKSDLKPKGFITKYHIEGVRVILINVKLSNKHSYIIRIFTFLTYALVSLYFALILNYEIIICSSGPITVGFAGIIAKWLRKKKFVFEVRDLWPEGAIQLGILQNKLLIYCARYLEKQLYKMSDLVVALSPGQKQWIQQQNILNRIITIPNASDNELVAKLRSDDFKLPEKFTNKILVIYAGTIGLIDDCDQIIEMQKKLQDSNYHNVDVIFIGDGNERIKLERKVLSQDIKGIHFLGLIPKHQVIHWLSYGLCSIFTVKDVPFLSTASPNKLFDAFAVGIPTIQVSNGWIHELIDKEQCGINVPVNNPAKMAEAVITLIQDKSYHKLLSTNAKRLANTRFSRDRLAIEMLREIEKIK